MHMKKLFAVAILASASLSASAQTANAYDQCLNDTGGNMPAMIDCASEEAKRQDKRLNAVYKVAMGRVANKDNLRNTQRAWIKERDKACGTSGENYVAEDGEVEGGQTGWLMHHECVARKTAQRADELEAMK
ncbi:MAG: lysozyme inhibitor LprI family protein [Zoogloeaceae bacterium]|jgi:uncharacterized protein YecT (DUF1311 family)|nr:lysozyme inhibitor LprI family protein [Zoogloeaceae bacterium]